jgi:hypothetical protein
MLKTKRRNDTADDRTPQKERRGKMKYRVALEGATGEHVVDVEASSDQDAIETATAKYDPLHLAQNSRVLQPEEEAKGSYFNRSFVITVKK